MDDKPNFPPFFDCKALTENQRCRFAADYATSNPGKSVAVLVDMEEKVIERYMRKIKERAPNATVERVGVFEGSYALKVTLKNNN